MPRGISRATTIVGLIVLVVASIAVAYAIGLLGAPSVSDVDNQFADVNETTTLIETNLTVTNPNPIGITLGDLTIDYTVRLNDLPMANGSKDGIAVKK